ncbi:hypothetical protein L6452_40084 [Arctium lappa]|uniref:Uncharacterized protein n=1 Tax=Arctium lappa TaxID=4217 RepID=A0ACB8XMQ1_ARCLA|nr:hypothetical protein L6452_40084 [Arctium lappa]
MPFEGISIEPQPSASTPLPDLSLQISPPNTCSIHKENTSQKKTYIEHSLPAYSSRSLAPSLTEIDQYHPQNLFHPPPPPPNHNHHRIYNQPPINGDSFLDASKCNLKPIKGIPVYHNRQFPFLPNLDEKDLKTMCLMYPSSTSSAAFPNYFGNHMPFLNPTPPRGSSSSGYSEARFSRSYQLQHHKYGGGVGPTSHEVSHGMIRSKSVATSSGQSDDGSGEDDSSTMGSGNQHHPNSSSATTTLWSNSSRAQDFTWV